MRIPISALPRHLQDIAMAQLHPQKRPQKADPAPALTRTRKTSKTRYKSIPAPFLGLLRDEGLPEPIPEYRFHPERRWRFDYAWPEQKVALEVDGGVWTAGRHTRGSGWTGDTEKLNTAASLGWRMLRCTPQQLISTGLIQILAETLRYNIP